MILCLTLSPMATWMGCGGYPCLWYPRETPGSNKIVLSEVSTRQQRPRTPNDSDPRICMSKFSLYYTVETFSNACSPFNYDLSPVVMAGKFDLVFLQWSGAKHTIYSQVRVYPSQL
jgi:hypothetical protein